MTRGKSSEIHACAHILDELKNKKGWNKKQIYTQQECHRIKPIADTLKGKKPENVVKISETKYWVIEAKNERIKINQALRQAHERYANPINKSALIKVLFITGIAGNNEEGYISKSEYLCDGQWTPITENGVEVTGILSKTQVEAILDLNNPNLVEVEISEKEFLKSAEEINGILHEGGINKDYRARVMSAILLALVEGTEIPLNVNPKILIDSINTRVDVVLTKHEKPDFARFVKIDLPSSQDNHLKFKKAIVLTIQELLGLNIRSAMNSGKDVLGEFYEVFLKYGNGAKEIGIVLTPRHITKFAAEVLDIQPNDLVFDPTCGTGGFLVAAFDEVKKKATEKDFKQFKKSGLYGIEQQDPVVSLAIVNMIFRGDGKTYIIEGDCFANWLNAKSVNGESCAEYLKEDKEGRVPPITKVLMNPPFPTKKNDLKEYLFVEQALKQMQNGGMLFSVLPYSCMIKSGQYLEWRKRLLLKNTLLSVVTFPEDLFYPIGVHTVGVFIKKGVPHKDQPIIWVRAINDGRWKKKGKRLRHPKAIDDYPKITPILKQFLKDKDLFVKNEPEFIKVAPLDSSDTGLELVPEVCLDGRSVTQSETEQDIEQMIRDNLSFLIKYEDRLIGQ